MKYLNHIKESFSEEDPHKQYLALSVKVIEMIKKHNDIVEEAEDIFYEVLDIIGHDVVPCYKVDVNEFHSPEWESRFGDNIEYINEEWRLSEYYVELDDASGKEVETMIVYQPACDSNNWVPAKLDERLMQAIKSLEERYSSIGCVLEYETSTLNMKGGEKGIWTISVAVPTKTDFSEILKSAVPKKVIKDFEQFCAEHNINTKGRQELARMLRKV